MKKFILCIVYVFLMKTTFSQNLVSNGNFETMNVCPSAYNQVTACATWSPAPNNINALYSSEYLNSCNSGLFNVPSSTWGFQAAKSGNGYMAVCMEAPSVSVDYRENIYTNLTTPLVTGATYSVSMYVSQTDNSKNSVNRIGLKFSKVASFPINNLAHVSTTVIITDNTNWTLISGSFVADSAYQYIAVGNFYTDVNTTASVSCGGCSFNQFGYFIEDVSVVQTAASGIDALNQVENTTKIYPNPSSSEFNIEIAKKSNVKIYNVLGQEVLNKTFDAGINKILVDEYNKGLYFIRVIDDKSDKTEKVIIN